MRLDISKWHDLHVHFRQGPAMAAYIQAHLNMGCAGVVAMPNTRPPVSRVTGPCDPSSWSVEGYARMIHDAGGHLFQDVIIPLYLTRQTSATLIQSGIRSGLLKACKYYPPHGTTNSEHGVPMHDLLRSDTLRAMEDGGVILCIHGEQHALNGTDYLGPDRNAESLFYRETMPRLLENHPGLRVVCEHITTSEAVDFVKSAGDSIAATITPQHLLFTLGDLIKGLRFHLYCLPVLKFERDRDALRVAVTEPGQRQFFAGTDSAPHTVKATECGCAAGCFTGGYAPQLYAMAFEEAGCDLASPEGQDCFKNFLCLNGPHFYGLNPSEEVFTLEKKRNKSEVLPTPEGSVTPLPMGLDMDLEWSIAGSESGSTHH